MITKKITDNMFKIALTALMLLGAASLCQAGEIKQYKTPYTTFHLDEEMVKTSKPVNLSLLDQVLLRVEGIQIGNSRTLFLINRLTDKVEYVHAGGLNRFIKAKFIMPDAQEKYNKWKRARTKRRFRR